MGRARACEGERARAGGQTSGRERGRERGREADGRAGVGCVRSRVGDRRWRLDVVPVRTEAEPAAEQAGRPVRPTLPRVAQPRGERDERRDERYEPQSEQREGHGEHRHGEDQSSEGRVEEQGGERPGVDDRRRVRALRSRIVHARAGEAHAHCAQQEQNNEQLVPPRRGRQRLSRQHESLVAAAQELEVGIDAGTHQAKHARAQQELRKRLLTRHRPIEHRSGEECEVKAGKEEDRDDGAVKGASGWRSGRRTVEGSAKCPIARGSGPT